MNKRGIYFNILFLIALSVGMMITASNVSTEQIEILKENITNTVHQIDFNFNETELAPEIGNALDYYITGTLYAYTELMSWVIDYAAANPQIPYKLLFWFFILAIISPLILVLFKLLVIIFLLVKEFIQNRKEKKELRKQNNDK